MKKHIRWVLLSMLTLFLAFVAYVVITRLPFYPAFQKPVDSFEEIQRRLSKDQAPAYPDDSVFHPFNQTYRLWLDGRSLISKPTGYLICGTFTHNQIDINYTINVNQSKPRDLVGAFSYRDVPILYNQSELSAGNETHIDFLLNGYSYTIETYYVRDDMPIEKQEALNSALADQLIELSHQIIDSQ